MVPERGQGRSGLGHTMVVPTLLPPELQQLSALSALPRLKPWPPFATPPLSGWAMYPVRYPTIAYEQL
jgi:hypothetical protein